MSTFDFTALLERYGEPFIRIDQAPGKYDEERGIWRPGGAPVEVELHGVIQHLSPNDLRYDQTGTWTLQDRKLFTKEQLQHGKQVILHGVTYTVGPEIDQKTHGGYYQYVCRREGAAPG